MQKKSSWGSRRDMWNHQRRETPVDLVVEGRGAREQEKENGCIHEMADAGWKRIEGGIYGCEEKGKSSSSQC